MRKLAVFIGVLFVVVLGIQNTAFAHITQASASCSKVSWSATSYESNQVNTIEVKVDGTAVYSDANFGTTDVGNYPWSQAVDHSWSVKVNAPGTQYDFNFSGTQKACQPPQATTTTTTTTTVPPTTTTTTIPPTTTTQPPVTTVPDPDPTTTVPGLPQVTTDAPTFIDPECGVPAGASVFLADTVGVIYDWTGEIAAGGTVVVTATASAGFVLAPEAVTTWTHTFATVDPNCGVTVTTVDVPATVPGLPATGAGDSSANLTVIALALIGIGAVLLRVASKPAR